MLKNDRWIKKMAKEYGMIKPFIDHLVTDGVISYGLGSYGYDIRVADEFRIFTNVNATVVDPKNFDTRSFFDFKGPVCLIPPNSFALGRSIEYFRIPRNVMALCVGKSTYARCFTGDTKVQLADGRQVAIAEMVEEAACGIEHYVYTILPTGRVGLARAIAPRKVGRERVIRVTLDNGETIRCTPDHKFRLRDGSWAEAQSLKAGDALMPLDIRRRISGFMQGYQETYDPLSMTYVLTHILADEYNTRHFGFAVTPYRRHHRDHNKLNNNPSNIERVESSEHAKYHNKKMWSDPEFIQRLSRQRRLVWQDPEYVEWMRPKQAGRSKRFWTEECYKDKRERLLEKHRLRWADPKERLAQSERLKMVFKDPIIRVARSRISKDLWAQDDGTRRSKQAEIARWIRLRRDITLADVQAALEKARSLRGAARLLKCDRTVFKRFVRDYSIDLGQYRNHTVAKIEDCNEIEDVYCLTVPESGNFGLAAGIFVQNCGIVSNVTPLEAGWEGHVTIEISNTTPLPARIYANEGICQVLFLESDEVCEVSYADRRGKYMGQKEITLPKV